ncbi:MAG: amidohydrolase family protein [Ignavibacteria bacterium]|nr:amidohydrolase family protein [Ignavibacteria bacterium]
MRIIDGHTHIGKWSEQFYNYETTVDEAIEVFKRNNIEAAVCFPSDKTENEHLLKEVKQRSDFKFYFTAWINPENKNLMNFLLDNIKDIYFIKIHPSLNRRKITDELFKPFIEYSINFHKPIIVHCGRWTEIAGYQHPLELADKNPELKIILAHLGGDQPNLCIPCAKQIKERKLENVYLGTESVREFYFVHQVIKIVGAEKVIFGSDYNLGLPDMYIPLINSLNLTEIEKEKIFSGNILSLINEK